MFLMRNKEGNIEKKVATVSRKEALEAKGYVVIDSDNEQVVTDVEVEPQVDGGQKNTADGEGKMTDPADGEQETVDEFEKMTIPKLKEYAKENGIDIKSTQKADIIAEIKKALNDGNTADDTELE